MKPGRFNLNIGKERRGTALAIMATKIIDRHQFGYIKGQARELKNALTSCRTEKYWFYIYPDANNYYSPKGTEAIESATFRNAEMLIKNDRKVKRC